MMTVSYTHLDVYKRQTYDCGRKSDASFIGENFILGLYSFFKKYPEDDSGRKS